MLEHGVQYFPDSVEIYQHLVKVYSKLGMSKCVTDLSRTFPATDDDDYERLGAARFSLYSNFGMIGHMDELLNEQKTFFQDKINENKNKVVTSFLSRNFQAIYPLLQHNEVLSRSQFHDTV